jgi:hypothetical protein
MIDDLTIQSGDIGPLQVTTGKIALGAVDSAQLAPSAVGNTQLAGGAVSTGKIQPLAVDTAQLALGAVNTSQLANSSVDINKLAANAVDSTKIVNGSIANADMGTDSVVGANVAAGSLRSSDIAAPNGSGGVLVGSVGVDPGNVVAGTCSVETPTVAGVAAGDHVILNGDDPALDPALEVSALTPAVANQLRLRVCNHSAVDVDDSLRSYSYLVIR